MRLLILIAMTLFAAVALRHDAHAAVATPLAIAQPASDIVQIGYCGCRHRGCGGCGAHHYTAYRHCGTCGCGGCASAYRPGYGYAGYGCGCGSSRCGCGYCYHGCGYGGRYGYPRGYPACQNCGCNGCGLYSYTTGCGGGCGNYGYHPNGYYNGGWSVFGWLF
jgi:hypothetical protein